MQTGTREGLTQSHRPRRLKVYAYYTAQARVNYIALSMGHARFWHALSSDLSPFAFARRVKSVGNDPDRGACTRSSRALNWSSIDLHGRPRCDAWPSAARGAARQERSAFMRVSILLQSSDANKTELAPTA
jgi:hypothetical protein